ncbi:MAG TPA: citrate lyase acyl carrier protein, partial [bacterium]|nr:citrate lyase acyl carrier protein [bacterium]
MEYLTGRAGRDEKSDLVVEIEMRREGGLEIQVNSSVKALFGKAITATAAGTLQELGIGHARVTINDKGALDWVIRARIEAAARAAGYKSGLKPLAVAPHPPADRNRLRRTRLYLPGSNPDLMLNAHLFGADCLILDLEDSVAPVEKFATRILVKHALAALEFGSSERIVRINPLQTPY